MSPARALPWLALAGVAIVLAVLLLGNGSDTTRHRIETSHAFGLRENSDVRVGGVSVGHVEQLDVTDDDKVVVELELNDDDVVVGRGAEVTVKAANLLGEKFLALEPGDPSRPLGEDASIPGSLRASTDLDQLLDVLDPDTRTRLAILLNEAGAAVLGRGADLRAALAKLPPSVHDATELLEQVAADNRALGSLITSTDGFLARAVQERPQLARMIDTAGGAATTFAGGQAALRRTLAEAPGGLSTLRSFLADLRTTATPLRSAARQLASTAPSLRGTLAQLAPFRRALRPLLRRSRTAAPSLSRLAKRSGPVLESTTPTLNALTTLARSAAPLTKSATRFMPDALGVMEGWSRAIQGRDVLGHVFHGRAIVSGDALRNLLSGLPESDRQARSDRTKARTPRRAPAQQQQAPQQPTPPTTQPTPQQSAPAEPSRPDARSPLSILDLLLKP